MHRSFDNWFLALHCYVVCVPPLCSVGLYNLLYVKRMDNVCSLFGPSQHITVYLFEIKHSLRKVTQALARHAILDPHDYRVQYSLDSLPLFALTV